MVLLRLLGTNLYIENVQDYMDELESVEYTTEPTEAYDFTELIDGSCVAYIDSIVEHVKEDRKALIEQVIIL